MYYKTIHLTNPSTLAFTYTGPFKFCEISYTTAAAPTETIKDKNKREV